MPRNRSLTTILHRDGTVTYWSVIRQQWIRRTGLILAGDYPTFGATERDRILRHFARHDEAYPDAP